MKQFFFVIILSFSLTFSSFAQDITLEGKWKLVKIEVTDHDQKNLPVEEAFFAYYSDPTQFINIDKHFFPIVVGGEEIPYNYKIDGENLLLIYTNTVIVKEGDLLPKEQTSIGETKFNIHLEGNLLTLTRRNETFNEFYQFQKNY